VTGSGGSWDRLAFEDSVLFCFLCVNGFLRCFYGIIEGSRHYCVALRLHT
jgi:hypothetical protein